MTFLQKIILLTVGIVLIFISLALRQIFKDSYFGFFVMLSGGLVFLVASFYLLRNEILSISIFKKIKGLLISLFALILLVTANFVTSPLHRRFDLTENKSFTLSDFSQKVLKKLNNSITIYYLHITGDEYEKQKFFVKRLLKKYQNYSDKIKFEPIDVYKNPVIAKKFSFQNEKAGLFLENSGRIERIASDEELSITNAIYRSMQKKQNIYFAKGHGERSVLDESEEGISFLRKEFEKLFINIVEIDLTQNTNIPDEVNHLFIIGPKLFYDDKVIERLKIFSESGGKLVLALDPLEKHYLSRLTNVWGVQFLNQVIFDSEGKNLGFTEHLVLAKQTKESEPFIGPINSKKLFMNYLASPLSAKVQKGIDLIPLTITSSEAKSRESEMINSQLLIQGEMVLSFFAVNQSKGMAFIFGDSDIFSNKMIYQGLNPYMIRSILGKVTQIDELVAMPPQEAFSNPIVVTPIQEALYFWFFVVPLPFFMLFISAFLWLRQRMI